MPNRIIREGILTSARVARRTGIWPIAVRRALSGAPCAICGSDYKPCIDHRVPLARGGSNEIENLQILCEPCNLRKGAWRTDEEMRQWYLKNKAVVDKDRRNREVSRFNLDRF